MAAATCPHCFAPVRGDGRPTCLCAAVEAEDFDPLRIRPYVSLREHPHEPDGEAGGGRESGDDRRNGAGAPPGGWRDRREELADLPGVDAAVHRAPCPTGPTSETFLSSDAPPKGASTPVPPPEGAAPPPPSGPGPEVPAVPGPRRPRPAVWAGTGAAVAVAAIVIGTVALPVGGRDRAAPPDRGSWAPTTVVPTPVTSAPTSDRPSPATSRSRRPPGVTPRPYRTRVPPTPPPVRASGSVAAPSGGTSPSPAPTGPIVLREGSSGPEVVELQGRLRQTALYTGAADGRYGATVRDAVARYQETYGVHGDPDGVYGPATRASLEARTVQP
ncbi:peptidoglycan-binding domain-containing protein [Streptomyces sp. WZ-12]|uniref:peptidoglycan-binding domain-containing protein n=1 Tax=Streptomyces sp. WZ-12 TaxID=3030210 RepID=UPI0023815C94|nr:peptidoglycan-binding protein [Streptomyces sp. WZ-12]